MTPAQTHTLNAYVAGVNAGLRVMDVADRRETRTGKHSTMAKAFGRFLGG